MSIFTKKDAVEVISGKFEKYNADLEAATAAVEEAEKAAAIAKTGLEEAADSNDIRAFSAAKARLSEAEEAVEMSRMRKSRIISRGATAPGEVEDVISSFKREIDRLDSSACAEIVSHIDKILEIANTTNSEIQVILNKIATVSKMAGRPLAPDERKSAIGIDSQAQSFVGSQIRLDALNRDSIFFRTAKRSSK